MGKPIAARNRYPFGTDGIVVGGAVLRDGTKLTNIKISKQRSDVVFDLLSVDGISLYTFLSLTSKDVNGVELVQTKTDAQLVDLLKPGTFYIRAIDTSGVDRGFIFSILLNKVILSTGQPVFNWNIHGMAPIPATSVSLNKSTVTMTVGGGTETLVATVLPVNATNKNVTWSSSDITKATVINGVVTAVSSGTSNITVTTVDGSFTAVCVVTVS